MKLLNHHMPGLKLGILKNHLGFFLCHNQTISNNKEGNVYLSKLILACHRLHSESELMHICIWYKSLLNIMSNLPQK